MLNSCDDLFEPAIENFKDVEQMYDDAQYAQGFLVNVYRCVPGYYDNSEYATDDAVINQKNNAFLTMATGGWTSRLWTPINQWTNSFSSIQYINLFLENVDQVKWSDDAEKAQLFARRTKGEAYGLRGMFLYYLLRAHAGYGENGELLGVPRLTEYLTINSDLNLPRASFADCVQQIYSDLEKAEELLPWEYNDANEVPADYQSITQDKGKYNTVMGQKSRQLFNGLIARAYRVRTALLAASPAFAEGSKGTWAEAADYNGEILDLIGGVAGLAAQGNTWYKNADEINSLTGGSNPPEMLWRNGKDATAYSLEQAQFPPSLYGSGQINPTQNLVDAFPMANGYPIDSPEAGYDDQNPYANRDPRLALYIVVNGTVMGTDGKTIDTSVDNTSNNDGLNKENGYSTRTGYYLRKHLREDVYLSSTTTTGQPHYSPRIRYTEIYLNYAEAANEAWGPTGTGLHGYSAYDVIKAIRQRAGIKDASGNDPYLESVKNDQAKMRDLIRNERRLELCFEGFRFWDLRRWNMDLNEPAKGIRISGGTYQVFNVESRTYNDFMRFGPIPYSEVVKFDALEQNKGWD